MSLEVLCHSQYALTSFTTVYTAGAKTIIDKFTATNVSLAAVTVTIALVPSGEAAGSSNTVVTVSIEPGQAYLCGEVVGHILDVGDFLSVKAGVSGSIVIRGSGRK